MKLGIERLVVCLFVLVMIFAPLQASAAKLSAGDVDDNLNYNQYISYVDHIKGNNSKLPSLGLQDRVTVRVVDGNGANVSNALIKVTIVGQSSPMVSSKTGTDGIFHFFPTHDGAHGATDFVFNTSAPDGNGPYAEATVDINNLDAARTVKLIIKDYTAELPTQVDLALVIDCTGSMGDELTYLTSEFSNIISKVQNDHPGASMRYGLVVYRDEGDDYVVRHYDFTDSVHEMQTRLAAQASEGGGDYEEAVHKGLDEAVNQLEWRSGNTLKLLFHAADAPPHDEYLGTAISVVDTARAKGIHMFPLGGSGVGDIAEYIMRAEASLTGGRYMFLTDDSGIGNTHADPHITCYIVTDLDNLIVRVVESQLLGTRVEPNKADIIRTVGNYTKGVCLVEDQTTKDPPRPKVLADGILKSGGGPATGVPSMTFPMVCAAIIAIVGIKAVAKKYKKER
jgi:hypothetical protein